MGSMFKKTDAPAKTEVKKPGKQKDQIAVKNLQKLAVLDALIKQATALVATIKSDVTEQGFDEFTKLAGSSTRPKSFEGVDGLATASIEARKRSSASVLTDEEVEELREAGLEPEVKVVTPFVFHINPAYANDEALLAKVEKAIEKIVPEDFIQQQHEVKKYVVSDEMLDEAFTKDLGEDVLRMLVTMAVKPRLTEKYDMKNLLVDAFEIMRASKEDEDELLVDLLKASLKGGAKAAQPAKDKTTKPRRKKAAAK